VNRGGQAQVLRFRAPDGARLCYCLDPCGERSPGRCPALVLLHGLASNHTRFAEFMARTRLRGHWTLLAPDLRGHGCSLYRGRVGHDVWCRDLAALLDHAGVGRPVLLGHSLGAQLALVFARRHPEAVRGLILVDPVFPEALAGPLAAARRLRWLLAGAIALVRLANALGLRRRRLPQRDLWALDEATRARLAAEPGRRIADLYMSPWADLRYIPLAVYLQELREVTRPLPAPETITVPVRVLLSAGAATSETAAVKEIVARFPDVHVTGIDADHWMLTERPVETRAAIERYCEELAGGGGNG